MLRNTILILSAASLFTLTGASETLGQDALLSQLYGSGVHAYYAKDYKAAHEQFSTAIKSGSLDPRCCYFRGLSYLKLGREEEARVDFEKGAELEAKADERLYDVAKSLQRVQGNPRVMLEEYRVKARMALREQAESVRRARFEKLQREEPRVVRPRRRRR